jgi:hypothetical protein
MDAHTGSEEMGPGWRELVEALHGQLDAARERETMLIRLLDRDREALLQLIRTTPTSATNPTTPAIPVSPPRAGSVQPPQQPSPLHKKILALLAEHPEGCTPAQVEAAVGADRRLDEVLRGLWRRGRLARPRQGVYALPTGPQAPGVPA